MKFYYCPQDKEVLLFTENNVENIYDDRKLNKMVIPDRPMTCPKCGKSYYKSECVIKEY